MHSNTNITISNYSTFIGILALLSLIFLVPMLIYDLKVITSEARLSWDREVIVITWIIGTILILIHLTSILIQGIILRFGSKTVIWLTYLIIGLISIVFTLTYFILELVFTSGIVFFPSKYNFVFIPSLGFGIISIILGRVLIKDLNPNITYTLFLVQLITLIPSITLIFILLQGLAFS